MNVEEHFGRVDRARVWAACYRITGCAADADEVLQEAFARALETRPEISAEAPLEPWLSKVAVRLAIDRLRKRRETPYDGPWLPSPVENDEASLDVADETTHRARYEVVESATFAFLIALEALSPLQRAVVVLRDVQEMSAAETADVLDETEENVRTLHRRARVKLAAYDSERVRPDAAMRARAQELLETLFTHLVSGDLPAAMALLADSARLVNDAGGVFHAARKVVVGPDRIVRFFAGLLHKVGVPNGIRIGIFNGLPAFEMTYDHVQEGYADYLITGVLLDREGHVETLYSVLAPRKLVHLA